MSALKDVIAIVAKARQDLTDVGGFENGMVGVPADGVARLIERLESALRRLEAAEQEPELAKYQPCGCVICTCEDTERCHGCGAKNCGKHPIGVFENPLYTHPPVEQAAPVGEMTDEVGWLIEATIGWGTGNYWAPNKRAWVGSPDYYRRYEWTTIDKACRFARKQDAEAVIEMYELRKNGMPIEAREHMWVNTVIAASRAKGE